jgi:uncharacterized protein (DUF302 family)
MAVDGLITRRSSFGPEETMKRLEADVQAKGLTVFAHIDHAAGAKAVGLPLRPTDLLIFGNARGGTPLMQAAVEDRSGRWQDCGRYRRIGAGVPVTMAMM